MIVTEFYNGQGLGNQLWCYLVTRVIAHKNGYDFGIKSTNKFKGKEFINIDFGLDVIGGDGPEGGSPNNLPNGINYHHQEKMNRHPNGIDITKTDYSILSIPDNSKVDGNLQSLLYVNEYRDNIKEWLKITKDYDYNFDDNLCVIHVRGGDFLYSSAFLNKQYYDNAIQKMILKNPDMKFVIITDDINYSRNLLPDIPIIGGSSTGLKDANIASHHIGGPIWIDWCILSKTKNVIMSASSFSFWPVYLNDDIYVIAPMYWGDYKNSDGYWSCGDMIVESWNYLNKDGLLLNSKDCLKNKKEYEEKNKEFWI